MVVSLSRTVFQQGRRHAGKLCALAAQLAARSHPSEGPAPVTNLPCQPQAHPLLLCAVVPDPGFCLLAGAMLGFVHTGCCQTRVQ